MPKRQKTGATLLTTEQLMAKLNMSRDEVMVLVKNGIPHIKRDEKGRGVYYLFPDREVLAIVSPLPANREIVPPKPAIIDEEEVPIEIVRPEPRPVPSMTSMKPPATTAKPSKPVGKSMTPKSKTK